MSKYRVENSVFADLHETDNAQFEDTEIDLRSGKEAKSKDKDKGTDAQLDIDREFEVEDDEDDDRIEDLKSEADPDEGEEEDEEEPEKGAADESEEEADEEDEDEGESYSKKVKARIDRERRRANRERERREALESRLTRLESRAKVDADEKEFESFKATTEAKLAELRAKKKEAIENGDTDAQIDLDEKILDARSDLKVREARVKEAKEVTRDEGEIGDGIDLSKMPPKAREWIDRHPRFKNDARFRRIVLAADNLVSGRGLNPNTERYYDAIEKIVADDFPDEFGKSKRKDRDERKGRKPVVTNGRRNQGAAEHRKPGRVKITADDKARMSQFGLDPENPQHLREWAANKMD